VDSGLIQEPDIGAKPIALQTLLLIASTYGGGGIRSGPIHEWMSLLAIEFLSGREEMVSSTIPVIMELIRKYRSTTPRNARRAALYKRIAPNHAEIPRRFHIG
jgi:hypothetical protein